MSGTGEAYTNAQPRIADRCPTCGAQSLFIGADGWLTCGVIGCKNPSVTESVAALRRKSVLQDWVTKLGLRHQGVLLTAVRGCDTSPKEDAAKALVRCYRAAVLNAHCGDPRKARTFIEAVTGDELRERMKRVRRDCDHYPQHYLSHLMHAAQIVGYEHPDVDIANAWLGFYDDLVYGLHLNPETKKQMDARLGSDEVAFAEAQTRYPECSICRRRHGPEVRHAAE